MRKYVDVTVSKELLERLEKDKQEAVGQARYGRFKAWLHYANLASWQGQGWHVNYLNYMGKELHCTCGLSIPIDAEPEAEEVKGVHLDRVQRAYGHRNLPTFEGVTIAFIVDYEWRSELGDYWYQAFCQGCGELSQICPPASAKEFVRAHNENCFSDTLKNDLLK